MIEVMMLRDAAVFPSDGVLAETLGKDLWPVYEQFIRTVTAPEFGLTAEWSYYNDSKAWLAKVCRGKKTVFWLSVWEGYFRASLFFTEKYVKNIVALDIEERIKRDFCEARPVGKLIPMLFNVTAAGQIPDLLKVIQFKISAK